jgi:formylglycine-generating enzyme required for sulfatase activity
MPIPPRARLLLLVLLSACGGGDEPNGTREVTPEARRLLAQHQDPKSWEDLDPTHPGTRRRDPRTGIVFRRVPKGVFTMGSTLTPAEQPPHEVELTRDYLLAETEVTVAQWQRWLDEHGGAAAAPPSKWSPQHPRTHVLFAEAIAFCTTYGYRLPTEAEWERACLGGLALDQGPWQAQRTLQEHAWFHLNSKDGPRPVGTRAANPFGLHDLLGSVWEYCGDWFAGYGAGARAVDPAGPAQGQGHVLRGGSWFSMPGPTPSLRSPEEQDPAMQRNAFTGFRPARSLE